MFVCFLHLLQHPRTCDLNQGVVGGAVQGLEYRRVFVDKVHQFFPVLFIPDAAEKRLEHIGVLLKGFFVHMPHIQQMQRIGRAERRQAAFDVHILQAHRPVPHILAVVDHQADHLSEPVCFQEAGQELSLTVRSFRPFCAQLSALHIVLRDDVRLARVVDALHLHHAQGQLVVHMHLVLHAENGQQHSLFPAHPHQFRANKPIIPRRCREPLADIPDQLQHKLFALPQADHRALVGIQVHQALRGDRAVLQYRVVEHIRKYRVVAKQLLQRRVLCLALPGDHRPKLAVKQRPQPLGLSL